MNTGGLGCLVSAKQRHFGPKGSLELEKSCRRFQARAIKGDFCER